MKKSTKIILIVVGSLIALIILSNLLTTDEQRKQWEAERYLKDSIKLVNDRIKLADDSINNLKLEHLANPSLYWNEYTYEEKKAWIEKFLESQDDKIYEYINYSNIALKKQFNYPSTVKLKYGGANFIYAHVVEADSGWVYKTGEVTAKNGFGLELRYSFNIMWKITPLEFDIIRIDISETY